MWQITDKLFLGDKTDVENVAILTKHGIRACIDCAIENPPISFQNIEVFEISLDDPDPDFLTKASSCFPFVDQHIKRGPILFFCNQGLNRSAAVLCLYLKKRNTFDIMADILTEAKENTRKTRIMYKCNLSHRQLEIYLNLLLEIGFLQYHSNKENNAKYYEITSRGLEFLKIYSKLKHLMI